MQANGCLENDGGEIVKFAQIESHLISTVCVCVFVCFKNTASSLMYPFTTDRKEQKIKLDYNCLYKNSKQYRYTLKL